MTIWKPAANATGTDIDRPGLDVDVEHLNLLYDIIAELGGDAAHYGISHERAGGRPDGKGHFQLLVASLATTAGALTRVLKAKFSEKSLPYRCKSKDTCGCWRTR